MGLRPTGGGVGGGPGRVCFVATFCLNCRQVLCVCLVGCLVLELSMWSVYCSMFFVFAFVHVRVCVCVFALQVFVFACVHVCVRFCQLEDLCMCMCVCVCVCVCVFAAFRLRVAYQCSVWHMFFGAGYCVCCVNMCCGSSPRERESER